MRETVWEISVASVRWRIWTEGIKSSLISRKNEDSTSAPQRLDRSSNKAILSVLLCTITDRQLARHRTQSSMQHGDNLCALADGGRHALN
jgi:hypothetical protein